MQLDTLRQEVKGDVRGASGGRGLLATGSTYPAFKAQTLITQLMRGQEHIVIGAHLDLTALPLRANTGCGDGCDSPLPEVIKTKSIRGNCKGPPSDKLMAALTTVNGTVGLLPLQEGQCLIIVPEDTFLVFTHRLWLDRLYIRAAYRQQPMPREYSYIAGAVFEELRWPLRGQGRRYVTRSTFQGDGVGPAVGIAVSENTFIENCTFANLGGDDVSDGCKTCSGAITANKGAAVHIVNSTFFDPVRLPGTTYVRAWDTARVLISGCRFEFPLDVPDELFYAGDNATIYTDDPAVRVRGVNGTTVDVLPASESPVQGFPKGSNRRFPRRTDNWFEYQVDSQNETLIPQPAYAVPDEPVHIVGTVETEAEAIAAAAEVKDNAGAVDSASRGVDDAAVPASASTDGSAGTDDDDHVDEDDSFCGGTVAAVILAVILALMLCALLLCAIMRRRDKRAAEQKIHDAMSAAKPQPGAVAGPHPGANARPRPGTAPPDAWDTPEAPVRRSSETGPFSHKAPCAVYSSSNASHRDTPDQDAPTAADPSSHGTDDDSVEAVMSSTLALPAAPPGAPVVDRLAFIHTQLTSISSNAKLFQQYKLLGPSHRLPGDQSVVAFAVGAYDREAYALKFFTAREPFDKEIALPRCTGGALNTLLPQIRGVHDPAEPPDGLATDGFGQPLAPCIVFTRGESLTQWLHRAKPDVFQAVTVLSHIATHLRDLHAAGYVHGDVKPAHVLHLQRENRWTVIDFDKAAVFGTDVTLDYTLEYAAPEVVAATDAGKSIVAHTSVDAWALGVLTYELLTGKKALDTSTDGEQSVRAQLRGDADLPWEGDRLAADEPQLGVFREAVLALLRRDPMQRATVEDLCNACTNVVASQTTGTNGPVS